MEKLKILVTVVERQQANKYIKKYEDFEVASQTVLLGKGTAKKDILDYLGIDGGEKAIILSAIKESKVIEALECVKEPLATSGSGIAFTISLTSIIGRKAYDFLMKNIEMKGAQNE